MRHGLMYKTNKELNCLFELFTCLVTMSLSDMAVSCVWKIRCSLDQGGLENFPDLTGDPRSIAPILAVRRTRFV